MQSLNEYVASRANEVSCPVHGTQGTVSIVGDTLTIEHTCCQELQTRLDHHVKKCINEYMINASNPFGNNRSF